MRGVEREQNVSVASGGHRNRYLVIRIIVYSNLKADRSEFSGKILNNK